MKHADDKNDQQRQPDEEEQPVYADFGCTDVDALAASKRRISVAGVALGTAAAPVGAEASGVGENDLPR